MVECDRCHRKFVTYAALKQHYGDQHSNAKWPDALEGKLTEEKSLQTFKANVKPTQGSHTKLIIAVVLILVVVGGGLVYLPSILQTSANPACANFPFPPTANQELAQHYHAVLLIYINGQQVQLPANIGEGDSGPCIQPLHVHADSPDTSVIHIETPQERTYTLGDFFRVWAATPGIGGPKPVVFNQNQFFNYTVGNGNELRMYVNGQQSTEYGSLVLQGHMVIVIAYGPSATTNWDQYQSISAETWPYSGY
jgi:hypothetical protein